MTHTDAQKPAAQDPSNAQDSPKDRTGYFRLPESLYAALEARAMAEDRPLSSVVRRAIAEYLSRPADAA
jgi:DNA-binding transcriptional MocR family regulator